MVQSSPNTGRRDDGCLRWLIDEKKQHALALRPLAMRMRRFALPLARPELRHYTHCCAWLCLHVGRRPGRLPLAAVATSVAIEGAHDEQ